MNAWSLSTMDYPKEERVARWTNALKQLCIPVECPDSPDDFDGQITVQVSPLGMEFALVESDAITFSGQFEEQPQGIWFSSVMEGEGRFESAELESEIKAGYVIYGPTGVPATLAFSGRFKQLFVRAPQLALNPRLVVPMALPIGIFRGRNSINRVFSLTLQAVADALPQLESHELRPVELAVTEFLLTCLSKEKVAFGLAGASGLKTSHFCRICQDIEAVLSDPDLSLQTVAEISGGSPRYVQKLFSAAGTSVSKYIRTRRLERCRQDLASPIHADLSISDICFRWGFNGTAHFSRIFRKEYDESPSEYRRAVLAEAGATAKII